VHPAGVAREAIITASAFAMAALLAISIGVLGDYPPDRAKRVSAEITRFGTTDSQANPGWIVIVARSQSGLIGQISVPPSDVFGCRVGDTIAADEVGVVLHLRPTPCTGAQ